MRKLAVMGAVAAAMLGTAASAGTATQTFNINGNLGKAVNSCFNIAVNLTSTDCSYARTRIPSLTTPSGPKFTGGFYERNSIGDSVAYVPVPGDGKLDVPVSGTLTIDTRDTPDPADDLISATWEIGGAVFNGSTGNGDRGLERWTKWTQVMAPTPVNAAITAGAGVEYVIGSRSATVAGSTQTGKPTPTPLCAAADPTDCLPSENAPATQDPPGFWDTTFSGLANPATNRIGIERTRGFGLFPPGSPLGPSPNPNIGGQTTGTFEGYECIDNTGDNDCIGSEILFGSSQIIYRTETGLPAVHPATGNCSDGLDNDADTKIDLVAGNEDPECIPVALTQPTTQPVPPVLVSPPGFENVILVLTTDGIGGLTANAFWTREYIIASGLPIFTDAQGEYTVENSYGSGRIAFTGSLPQAVPTAVADAQNVIEDNPTTVNVLGNDTLGNGDNVLSIEGAGPANGTIGAIAPTDTTLTYTPDPTFSGIDTFDYRLTDGDGDPSIATVTLTVSEKSPVAGNFTASSSGGNPTAAIPVLGFPTQLGTGTAAEHTVSITGNASNGSCAAAGGTVTFTPTPGINGAGFCDFLIADADAATVPGQGTDTGTLNVSISGNGGGGGGGGGGGPQLPSGGSSLDLLSLGALLAGLPLVARRRRNSR